MEKQKKYEKGSVLYHVAEMAHANVMDIRRLNGETDYDECFEDLPFEQKNILFDTIERIIKNPNWSAEDEHDLWLNHKINAGWTYDKKTDRTAKIHNCLVNFDRLSIYQKAKDEFVVSIIKIWIKLLTEDMLSKSIESLREDCN